MSSFLKREWVEVADGKESEDSFSCEGMQYGFWATCEWLEKPLDRVWLPDSMGAVMATIRYRDIRCLTCGDTTGEKHCCACIDGQKVKDLPCTCSYEDKCLAEMPPPEQWDRLTDEEMAKMPKSATETTFVVTDVSDATIRRMNRLTGKEQFETVVDDPNQDCIELAKAVMHWYQEVEPNTLEYEDAFEEVIKLAKLTIERSKEMRNG